MPAEPRFSVVIPAWNAAATIVVAVRSCLEQTYPPAEVLVIDNGSTDDTAGIVRTAFGRQVTLLRLERNEGPSAARNAGMDAATGSHIAFQDADDRWHPRKLEFMAAALANHPEAALIFHLFTVSEEAWHRAGLQPPPPATPLPFWKLLLRNPIGTPCAVVRRAGALRFDAAMRHTEDWDFFLRTAERGSVRKVDAPLTLLGRPVLSAGGQSAARWAMRRGEARAWAKLAGRRPLFALLLPFLLLWGLAKHLWGGLRRGFQRA